MKRFSFVVIIFMVLVSYIFNIPSFAETNTEDLKKDVYHHYALIEKHAMRDILDGKCTDENASYSIINILEYRCYNEDLTYKENLYWFDVYNISVDDALEVKAYVETCCDFVYTDVDYGVIVFLFDDVSVNLKDKNNKTIYLQTPVADGTGWGYNTVERSFLLVEDVFYNSFMDWKADKTIVQHNECGMFDVLGFN